MYDNIKIYYTAENITANDVNIQINRLDAEFVFSNTVITIDHPIGSGIHELTMTLSAPGLIKILDVTVNNASVRELLYLSWIQDGSHKIQPATQLGSVGQTWTLPFGNPVSLMLSLVCTKLPDGQFGTDLYKKYCIQYPNKISLPDHCPQFIKDFFGRDFDFTIADQDQQPVVDLHIDPALLAPLTQRVQKEYDSGQFDCLMHQGPKELNAESGWSWWRLFEYDSIARAAVPKLHRHEFEELFQVLDFLNIQDMYLCDIAFLQPGAFIAPHRDKNKNGHREFFIPLYSPPGNYIKLAGAEAWDILQRSCMINIVDFTHSVINTSDQVRSVMLIRCDVTKNTHLVNADR